MKILSYDEVPFDVNEAMRSGTFVSGMPGCGKSKLAMILIKKLLAKNTRVFVLDPSEVWADEGPIKRVQVIKEARLNIDVPKVSTVFNITYLLGKSQKQFVELFCRKLFYEHTSLPKEQRTPTLLVFEEAQIYLPEGVFRSKKGAEVKRITTLGRNFNIRIFIITQFAANVDKTPVKACGQKYMGYTDEPNDFEYLKGWIKANNKNTKYELLSSLDIGQFLYRFKKKFRKIHVKEYICTVPPEVVPDAPLFVKIKDELATIDVQAITLKSAILGMIVGICATITLGCIFYAIFV